VRKVNRSDEEWLQSTGSSMPWQSRVRKVSWAPSVPTGQTIRGSESRQAETQMQPRKAKTMICAANLLGLRRCRNMGCVSTSEGEEEALRPNREGRSPDMRIAQLPALRWPGWPYAFFSLLFALAETVGLWPDSDALQWRQDVDRVMSRSSRTCSLPSTTRVRLSASREQGQEFGSSAVDSQSRGG
jgi:hypothetical protein